MGSQIIRQPDGRFALYSTNTDTIAIWDASAEEIVEHFAALAAEDARVAAWAKLDHIRAGRPREAYHQFTMTWGEALLADREHGGEAWECFPMPAPVSQEDRES